MKEKIIELLKKETKLSYQQILDLLSVDTEELAPIISEMEEVSIFKKGKFYYLLDGNPYVRGTIVLRNNHLYLKTSTESIFVSDNYLDVVFDKDIVIAEKIVTMDYDKNLRSNAEIIKVVEHSNSEIICKLTKKTYRGKKVFKVVDPNSNYDEILVNSKDLKGAHIGDICVLKIKCLVLFQKLLAMILILVRIF